MERLIVEYKRVCGELPFHLVLRTPSIDLRPRIAVRFLKSSSDIELNHFALFLTKSEAEKMMLQDPLTFRTK